jgi:hypothetical protein
MDKRAGQKKKKEVTYRFRTTACRQFARATDAEECFLSYLATTMSCTGRLFIPNVRTKSTVNTAFMPLTRQCHKKSGIAPLFTISNDIPTGGDAITLIGYYSD